MQYLQKFRSAISKRDFFNAFALVQNNLEKVFFQLSYQELIESNFIKEIKKTNERISFAEFIKIAEKVFKEKTDHLKKLEPLLEIVANNPQTEYYKGKIYFSLGEIRKAQKSLATYIGYLITGRYFLKLRSILDEFGDVLISPEEIEKIKAMIRFEEADYKVIAQEINSNIDCLIKEKRLQDASKLYQQVKHLEQKIPEIKELRLLELWNEISSTEAEKNNEFEKRKWFVNLVYELMLTSKRMDFVQNLFVQYLIKYKRKKYALEILSLVGEENEENFCSYKELKKNASRISKDHSPLIEIEGGLDLAEDLFSEKINRKKIAEDAKNYPRNEEHEDAFVDMIRLGIAGEAKIEERFDVEYKTDEDEFQVNSERFLAGRLEGMDNQAISDQRNDLIIAFIFMQMYVPAEKLINSILESKNLKIERVIELSYLKACIYESSQRYSLSIALCEEVVHSFLLRKIEKKAFLKILSTSLWKSGKYKKSISVQKLIKVHDEDQLN